MKLLPVYEVVQISLGGKDINTAIINNLIIIEIILSLYDEQLFK